MQRAMVVVLCLALASCTFPLGNVQPRADKTSEQREFDTLLCKDKAHLAASGTGQQVGAFFLGMTIVGLPVAYALDRSTQRRVFQECMASRGYTVTPPEDGPEASPTKTAGEFFKDFVQTISDKPQHTAVAVAKDVKQWAWGGMWSADSPEAARIEALARCRHAVSVRSIGTPCQVYAVNGQVIEEQGEGGGKEVSILPTSSSH
jgi:hypothetical protein